LHVLCNDTPLGPLDPEGGGTSLFQNISNCLLVDMGLHPRRLVSSQQHYCENFKYFTVF